MQNLRKINIKTQKKNFVLINIIFCFHQARAMNRLLLEKFFFHHLSNYACSSSITLDQDTGFHISDSEMLIKTSKNNIFLNINF